MGLLAARTHQHQRHCETAKQRDPVHPHIGFHPSLETVARVDEQGKKHREGQRACEQSVDLDNEHLFVCFASQCWNAVQRRFFFATFFRLLCVGDFNLNVGWNFRWVSFLLLRRRTVHFNFVRCLHFFFLSLNLNLLVSCCHYEFDGWSPSSTKIPVGLPVFRSK